MLPSTMFRVPRQTAGSVNDRIRERTERSLDRYLHSPRIELDERLGELSREWDIERTLETNAAIFSLAGLGLGTRFGKAWLVLPVIVPGSCFNMLFTDGVPRFRCSVGSASGPRQRSMQIDMR